MKNEVKPIRKTKDYDVALNEMEKLWGAKSGTSEGDRLDVLTTLIDAYEAVHYAHTSEIARRFELSDAHVRRVLRFGYLAPGIVEAIADDRQPRSQTVKLLLQGIPCAWLGLTCGRHLDSLVEHFVTRADQGSASYPHMHASLRSHMCVHYSLTQRLHRLKTRREKWPPETGNEIRAAFVEFVTHRQRVIPRMPRVRGRSGANLKT